MPEWSILEWLDAGTVPLLVIIAAGLWRLDRRVLKVEVILETRNSAGGGQGQ